MSEKSMPPPIQIIRSKRRTLGLQISSDAQVIVRAPHRASMDDIQRWVDKNSNWIQKHQTRRQKERNEIIPMSDQERMALESSCRERAQTLLPARVAMMAAQASLTYQSVRISGATTRWGSCSRKGSLNFSWRLAMTPLWVVDYVVAHELAHLVHPNHSKRFWSKVGELYPDFKSARRWLRENQHRLNISLHYYKGQNDQAREIDYPYLDTDGYRLKDTQYIPNTVTPDPA